MDERLDNIAMWCRSYLHYYSHTSMAEQTAHAIEELHKATAAVQKKPPDLGIHVSETVAVAATQR